MKLLVLHPGEALASTRVRWRAMAPRLADLGASCELAPHPRSASERRALLDSSARFDLIVAHGRLPRLQDARIWRTAGPPVVFDFDDALPYRQRPRWGGHGSLQRRARFLAALRSASAFTCGNRYLASLVAGAAKPCAVVPSAVPLDVPQQAHGDPPSRAFRVGWIGGKGNLHSLALLERPLRELAAEREVALVVISDARFELPGCPVESLPWSLATQERDLAGLHAGVMPLEDTPWTRGKCAYKLLQYMAAAVPAVASPVGMNAELIRHGENGFLAASDEGWLDVLRRLAESRELRAHLGRAGRATVEAEFGYGGVAARLMEFFHHVLASRA